MSRAGDEQAMQVRSLMRRVPVTVSPDESLQGAASILSDEGIGALLVTKRGRLVGILSERDLVEAVAEGEVDGHQVWDHMVAEPVTIAEDTSVGEAAETMVRNQFRHLPVVDSGGGLRGIVTVRDLLFAALSETASEARQDWWDYLLSGTVQTAHDGG